MDIKIDEKQEQSGDIYLHNVQTKSIKLHHNLPVEETDHTSSMGR